MTTAPVREKGTMPMADFQPNYGEKDYYTVEEFMDKLAKDLGRHYGLNDIREAL